MAARRGHRHDVRRLSELRGGACRSTAVAPIESVEMAALEATWKARFRQEMDRGEQAQRSRAGTSGSGDLGGCETERVGNNVLRLDIYNASA